MKKLCQIAALFLCLFLAFINTGCDKEQDDNPVNPITPTLTTNPVSDKTVPIGCNDSISWETQGISSIIVKINGEMVSTLLNGSIKFSSITEEKIVEFEIPDNREMNKIVRLMPQSTTPKPVITLSVNPDRLPQTGGNVTISWVTTNADSVLHNSVWYAAQGSISYNVTDTTTYQFIAQGIGGQTSGSITVYVETVVNPPLTFEDYICNNYWNENMSEFCYPEQPNVWIELPQWDCELDDIVKYYPNHTVVLDRHELCNGETTQIITTTWSIDGNILQPGNCNITILNADTLQYTYLSFEILPDGVSTRDIIVRSTSIHP